MRNLRDVVDELDLWGEMVSHLDHRKNMILSFGQTRLVLKTPYKELLTRLESEYVLLGKGGT